MISRRANTEINALCSRDLRVTRLVPRRFSLRPVDQSRFLTGSVRVRARRRIHNGVDTLPRSVEREIPFAGILSPRRMTRERANNFSRRRSFFFCGGPFREAASPAPDRKNKNGQNKKKKKKKKRGGGKVFFFLFFFFFFFLFVSVSSP